MKKLLRSKANCGILEGFLSELLRDDIQILEILDAESNKDDACDKFNRVDVKVKNAKGELLLIEVQYERDNVQDTITTALDNFDLIIQFLHESTVVAVTSSPRLGSAA